MCGIYGFQVKQGCELTTYESTVIAHTLATAMESRGRDSFGGVRIPTLEEKNKEANIIRGVGRITDHGSSILKLASESRSFLGHTRTATVGKVSFENCHPFQVNHILGVHNGHISNWAELNKKYNRNYEVDSTHIFGHLAAGKDLEDIDGYGTFFWVNSLEDFSKIYLGRTTEGQIHFLRLYRDKSATKESDDNFALIWASEYAPLKRVADFIGAEYYSIWIDANKLYYVQDAVVYDSVLPFRLGSESLWEEFKATRENRTKTNLPPNKPHPQITSGYDYENTYLSRRERKAQKKKFEYFKKKAKLSGCIADAVGFNVHKGVGLKRHFVSENGVVATIYQCDTCNCDLQDHKWGWCSYDRTSTCKVETNKGCLNIPSICRDCGHYLVEGIHGEESQYDIVHCIICNEFCAPESMLVNRAYDEDEDTEVVDTKKSTEIRLTQAELIALHLDDDLDAALARVKAEEDGIAAEIIEDMEVMGP